MSYFKIDPFDGRWRMEEVFNYIYADVFSAETPPPGSLNAYWELLRMYNAAIAKTTNNLDPKSRFGVSALIKRLYSFNNDRRFTFVTFNHDLLIEKSLERLSHSETYKNIPWNLSQAYNIGFEGYRKVRGQPRVFRMNGSRESVRILKLHGSLNWVYRVKSGTDPKNSIRNPSTIPHCVNSQKIRTSLSQKIGNRRYKLVPLIVPPIYEKSSKNQTILGPLWQAASDALRSADEIIVFGYSFPDADVSAKALLRKSFCSKKQQALVTVIDTNPYVAAKIAELFEVESLRYCVNVPAFEAN